MDCCRSGSWDTGTRSPRFPHVKRKILTRATGIQLVRSEDLRGSQKQMYRTAWARPHCGPRATVASNPSRASKCWTWDLRGNHPPISSDIIRLHLQEMYGAWLPNEKIKKQKNDEKRKHVRKNWCSHVEPCGGKIW